MQAPTATQAQLMPPFQHTTGEGTTFSIGLDEQDGELTQLVRGVSYNLFVWMSMIELGEDVSSLSDITFDVSIAQIGTLHYLQTLALDSLVHITASGIQHGVPFSFSPDQSFADHLVVFIQPCYVENSDPAFLICSGPFELSGISIIDPIQTTQSSTPTSTSTSRLPSEPDTTSTDDSKSESPTSRSTSSTTSKPVITIEPPETGGNGIMWIFGFGFGLVIMLGIANAKQN